MERAPRVRFELTIGVNRNGCLHPNRLASRRPTRLGDRGRFEHSLFGQSLKRLTFVACSGELRTIVNQVCELNEIM